MLTVCVFVTRDMVVIRDALCSENLFVNRIVQDPRRSWTEVWLYIYTYITKAGNKHLEYVILLLFPAKMVKLTLPQCYVVNTLPVLFTGLSATRFSWKPLLCRVFSNCKLHTMLKNVKYAMICSEAVVANFEPKISAFMWRNWGKTTTGMAAEFTVPEF